MAARLSLQFLELVDTWPYGDILALGDGSSAQTSLSMIAHDLIVDRVYVHGVPGQEQKRSSRRGADRGTR